MNSNRERVGYIDTAAGIMILWLLWYHALWPLYKGDVLNIVPYLFYFMPWFFYKSGYFFSPKPTREVVRSDAAKLLKQYVIWSIIGYVLYIVQLFFYSDTITYREVLYSPIRNLIFIGAVPINRSLWFIPVLCIVHLLATVLNRETNLLIVGVISMLVAIALGLPNFTYMPRPVFATAWGLFFFCMGSYLRKYEQNVAVIIISIVTVISTIAFTKIPTWYDMAQLPWYEYVGWFPASVAGCIVLNNICRWIDKWPVSIFKWIGRHSMTFYVVQGIDCVLIADWLFHMHREYYNSWWAVLAAFALYAVTIIPLCFLQDIRTKSIKTA